MASGMQIFGEDGTTVLAEVNGQVLERGEGLASGVGLISASWAHLEAQMGGYMAALLETSPERTFALLERFRSAQSTSDAAASLAHQTLDGAELKRFLDVVTEFRRLAKIRNNIQHAVWSWKAQDPEAVYRAPAVDFAVLMLRIISADEPREVAQAFVDNLTDRYDRSRLGDVRNEIEALLLQLTQLSILRHRTVLKHPF